MTSVNKHFIILYLVFLTLLSINTISAMRSELHDLVPALNQQATMQYDAQADAEDKERLQYFEGTPTAELDLVFEDAPPEAKMIVKHLPSGSLIPENAWLSSSIFGW